MDQLVPYVFLIATLCFVTDGVNEMTHSETHQWVLSIKDPLVKGRFSVFICIVMKLR